MKRRLLPLLLTVVLVVALAVPMFAITAAAEAVALEITGSDFTTTEGYDANNNTKKEGIYSYTSFNVMQCSNGDNKGFIQWKKSDSYITIDNAFAKMEMKSAAGTFTVKVGDDAVTGTTSNGVTTYDLSGKNGTIKISNTSSKAGYVEYIKFYAGGCAHEWDEGIVTQPAQKGEEGVLTKTCTLCGAEKEEAIPPLGYSVSFEVPVGVTAPTVEDTLTVTMPSLDDIGNFYFAGWATETYTEETTTKPTTFYLANETVSLTADTTFYAVYARTEGGTGESGWVMKQLADINSDDQVVITMTASNGTVYALTSAQGSSAPPNAITVTLDGNKLKDTPQDNLIWNISNTNGELIIYPNGTTDKWLYCTDSNSGVRVGGTEKKGTEFTLKNGYLYCTDRGRYVGVYTTEPDWRCYTSTTTNIGNQTLAFYVLNESGTTYYTTSPVMPEIECTEPTFDAASMLVSNDLTLNYLVKVPAGFESALTVKFTMNKKTVEVIGDLQDDGRYLFAFKVGPQYVFDNIKAVLYVNGEDVGISVDEYSVAKYVQNVTAKTDDEALKTLLASVLVYGEQAKNYVDKTPGEALDAGDAPETEAKVNRPDDNNLANCFVGAGVKFECKNSLYVIIRANSAFTLKIGDIEVNSDDDEIIDAHNGEYFFYLPVAIQDFDVLYNFEMYVGGVKTHSITYSVDTYLAQMWNWDKDLVTANLVKATYMLGAAASAYEAVEDKFN